MTEPAQPPDGPAQPPAAPPVPPPAPPVGPAAPAPKGLPRWFGLLLALVVVLALGATAARAFYDRPSSSPRAQQSVEPAHDVVYRFTTAGSANEDFQISYINGDGREEKTTQTSLFPVWSQKVHLAEGMPFVSLNVSARSSDFAFRFTCTIEVDGFIETSTTGAFCWLQVDFPLKPGKRTPAPSVPSAPPRPSTTPPPVPAGCDPVSEGDMLRIVQETAGVYKLVQSTRGDAQKCTYVLDVEAGWVTFSWTPGQRDTPHPLATRVTEIDVPAYWTDYGGRSGYLEAYPPKGMFRVDLHFLALEIDARLTAIRMFEAARPKLA